MFKACNKCNQTKNLTDFYKDKAIVKDGHATICKACRHVSQAEWRERNREKYNADMRAYNKANYTRLRLQRYKLTEAEYLRMLAEQAGACKICFKRPSGKRPLAVDHCHKSGRVRGLLCYSCNRFMAAIDNDALLAKLVDYKKAA